MGDEKGVNEEEKKETDEKTATPKRLIATKAKSRKCSINMINYALYYLIQMSDGLPSSSSSRYSASFS